MAERARGFFCRFLLVRRGPLPEEAATLALGHCDPAPDPGAEAMEPSLFARLAEFQPQIVLTSDLRRAAESAGRLGLALDLEVRRHAELRERSLGSYDGRSWPSIIEADPEGASRFLDRFATASPPGGETMDEVRKRALPVLHRTGRAHRRGVVVYLGHAGVIRTLLGRHLGLPPSKIQRFQLDPFGLSILDVQGPTATLVACNVA